MKIKKSQFNNEDGRLFSVELNVNADNFMQSMIEFFDISDENEPPYPMGIACGIDVLLIPDKAVDSFAMQLHQESLPMWGITPEILKKLVTWITSHQVTTDNGCVKFQQNLQQTLHHLNLLETEISQLKPHLSSKQQQKMIVYLLSAKKQLLKAELLF